jgi:hypothetical protein
MNIAEYIRRQVGWSRVAFGPGRRTEGILKHIAKEIEEVREAPLSTEWIDIMILAFDGAWRAGYTPEQIEEALIAKQKINAGRRWPDWRTLSQDEPSLHIKED